MVGDANVGDATRTLDALAKILEMGDSALGFVIFETWLSFVAAVQHGMDLIQEHNIEWLMEVAF